MLWKEYVDKQVSKKQKNWLTGIGIYFLVEIGGIWLFMISIFLLYRFYVGNDIAFFELFPWYGFVSPILCILFAIGLIREKKMVYASLLTVFHCFSVSAYLSHEPVNWVIAAIFMFGIIVGIIAWVMLRRIEKAYKKTAGYVAPDRQLRL